jgi:hypothetical protein
VVRSRTELVSAAEAVVVSVVFWKQAVLARARTATRVTRGLIAELQRIEW